MCKTCVKVGVLALLLAGAFFLTLGQADATTCESKQWCCSNSCGWFYVCATGTCVCSNCSWTWSSGCEANGDPYATYCISCSC